MERIFEFNNLRFSPEMFCHISVINDDCCVVAYGCFFLPEHLQVSGGANRKSSTLRRSCLNAFLRWPPSVSGSGGRSWPVAFAVLLSLVLSAPSPSLVILPLLGCFVLSLFRLALGRTSLWILLRVCLPPQEIR